MLCANEMRRSTIVNTELVEQLVTSTHEGMLRAAEKGMHHFDAWVYDRFDRKWLGDIPDAVIDEAERRFREAGYQFEWQGKNSYIVRVIKW